MKKQIIFFAALALFALGIISSCTKDPDPINNNQSSDKITFGDTTGMVVTCYDSIMKYDEHWLPFILDLNGDGTDDIKIETYYDGPLAIGEFQTLTLYCLNNQIELLADSVLKESYSHRETTTDTIDDYIVTTRTFVFSTCGEIAENDPVNTSKVFEVNAKDSNEVFDIGDQFLSGDAILFRENVHYSLADPGEEMVEVSENKYIYDCWNFPTDEEKYIGFKLTRNGKSRLGWLKIKLIPTWDGRVVDTELIETAVQE